MDDGGWAVTVWGKLFRFLRSLFGRQRPGSSTAEPSIAGLLAREDEQRQRLAQVEAERERLRRTDQLKKQALERLECQAEAAADGSTGERLASDIVYLRRERDALAQQMGLQESLRTQIQSVLLSLGQLRILSAQHLSPEELGKLAAIIDRQLGIQRETEAALENLRSVSAYAASSDVEVGREADRLRGQAVAGGDVPIGPASGVRPGLTEGDQAASV